MATEQTEGTAGSPAGGTKQSDAMIDTSEPARGTQKVELDLEDAPFLEEEEEVTPEPVKPAESIGVDAEPEKKPGGIWRNKKVLIIAGAAIVVLILLAVAAKLLFFKGKTAAPPKAETHAEANATSEANATQAKPEQPEVQVRMEPFWVEQKGEGEEVRFLIVRMLLTTKDQTIAKEFVGKRLAARNAIFYYLKNKDVQFLTDEHNVDKLKSELLLVINQYVTDGKFETLMFEEYVVK